MCGEYQWDALNLTWEQGSPPRVRGIPTKLLAEKGLPRITPACAGNTAGQAGRCPVSWDHPRVCGEYVSFVIVVDNNWGSPPRVRGIPSGHEHFIIVGRITPACAGNTAHFYT